MINDTAAKIHAGATPIEINCKMYELGSILSLGSIRKKNRVIISATNMINKPRLVPARYFSTAIGYLV